MITEPDKILRAHFDGREYYPFDEKYVWVNDCGNWRIIPCPDELMYTETDGLLEIIVDFDDPVIIEDRCLCDATDLFRSGCKCGGC